MVNDHHHFVFHDIGRVFFYELLLPTAAKVRHEPQHVAPPRTVAQRMGIAFLVAKVMVLPMVRHPSERRAFTRQPAQESEKPTHWPIGFERTMRQAAMVTHANAHRTGDQDQRRTREQRLPTEIK